MFYIMLVSYAKVPILGGTMKEFEKLLKYVNELMAVCKKDEEIMNTITQGHPVRVHYQCGIKEKREKLKAIKEKLTGLLEILKEVK